jgi:hypothetical protein
MCTKLPLNEALVLSTNGDKLRDALRDLCDELQTALPHGTGNPHYSELHRRKQLAQMLLFNIEHEINQLGGDEED